MLLRLKLERSKDLTKSKFKTPAADQKLKACVNVAFEITDCHVTKFVVYVCM